MIFFCTEAWLKFDLSDGEKWSPEDSCSYNVIFQTSFVDVKENGQKSHVYRVFLS